MSTYGDLFMDNNPDRDPEGGAEKESPTLKPFIVYGIYEGRKKEVSLGAWGAYSGQDAMARADAWLNRPIHSMGTVTPVRVTRFEITGLT